MNPFMTSTKYRRGSRNTIYIREEHCGELTLVLQIFISMATRVVRQVRRFAVEWMVKDATAEWVRF